MFFTRCNIGLEFSKKIHNALGIKFAEKYAENIYDATDAQLIKLDYRELSRLMKDTLEYYNAQARLLSSYSAHLAEACRAGDHQENKFTSEYLGTITGKLNEFQNSAFGLKTLNNSISRAYGLISDHNSESIKTRYKELRNTLGAVCTNLETLDHQAKAISTELGHAIKEWEAHLVEMRKLREFVIKMEKEFENKL
jgi:hypothetical protein